MDLGILGRLLGDEVHKALAADTHEARIVSTTGVMATWPPRLLFSMTTQSRPARVA